MNKNTINKILLLGTLIYAGWCVAMALTIKPELIGFNFWCALAFCIAAFVISFVSVARMRVSYNRNLTEINALPLIASVAYFLVALIFNSFFVFLIYVGFRAVLISVNIVILAAFAAYRMFAGDYAEHVEGLSEQVTVKTSDVAAISSKLAAIAGKTGDAEMKKRILKIKETVDYSTNMTQPRIMESQEAFLLELNRLETMIDEGCSADAFNEKADRLVSIWKSRNSATIN